MALGRLKDSRRGPAIRRLSSKHPSDSFRQRLLEVGFFQHGNPRVDAGRFGVPRSENDWKTGPLHALPIELTLLNDLPMALNADRTTADIPVVVVTAQAITAEERARLNGFVATVIGKAGFDGDLFITEVRRAMAGHLVGA